MARQVLPIVGAVVGAYFGGPQGAQIGYAIGSLVGNAVDPLVVDGPKIGDVAAQTSSEGVFQPIVFGTAQIFGNVIDQGPNIIRRRKQQSGKGGGPVTITESLFKTFAIRLCVSWKGEEGIVAISRIWQDGKLVFDIRPDSQIPDESAEFRTKFTQYLGTADQLPDPDLEAIHGVGNVPTYRGRAYVVFPMFDITDTRRIPQFQFEVVTGGTAVEATSMIAVKGVANDAAYWRPSPDGLDWTAPWTESLLLRKVTPILATTQRYIADNPSLPMSYLEDVEENFQAGTGSAQSSVGGYKLGDYSAYYNTILIPRGLDGGYLRSDDGGLTSYITHLGTTTAMTKWMPRTLLWYSFNNLNRKFKTSADNADSWSADIDLAISSAATFCGCVSDVYILVGGSTILTDAPAIAEIIGTTVRYLSLPATEGNSIAFLKSGINPAEQNDWADVAVLSTGEILYRASAAEDFQLSDFVFPVTPGGLTHNGRYFFLTGGDAANIESTGCMYRSVNGRDWIEVFTEPAGSFTYTSLVALLLSGGSVTDEPPHLDEVVAKIHEWCGQDASEYDVTELATTLVRGWVLSGAYTGKDCINSMQGLWFFDSPEYDGKIRYSLRGKPVIRTFGINDLVAVPDEAVREQAIEYPRKVHLDYQSPDVDYAPAKATSSRSSADARVLGELNVQVPVVLTPDEAAQRVAVMHKVSWADADGEVKFQVSDQHLDLVDGDCIGLDLRGSLLRLRIDQMEIMPGVIGLTCRYDRQTAYVSEATGIAPAPPTPPPPSLQGPTMISVLDINPLRDADDVSTFVEYIAMGGVTPAWSGALDEVSTDLGTTWSDLLRVNLGAVMGSLLDPVSASSPYYQDNTNVVRVQLDRTDGSIDIDSLTNQQFLSEGGGFALINPDGMVEVCQYRDAEDLGDGLYELRTLIRGRNNSGTSDHPAGSRFVLLETVAVVTVPSSHLGQDIYHRATSFGRSPETGTIVHGMFNGNSQREWPVAYLFAAKVGDTVEARAVLRHRLGTAIAPLESINYRGLHWTLTDGVNSINHSGTAANEDFDVTGWSTPITVSVAQVNRLTGDGQAVIEEIAA